MTKIGDISGHVTCVGGNFSCVVQVFPTLSLPIGDVSGYRFDGLGGMQQKVQCVTVPDWTLWGCCRGVVADTEIVVILP